MRKILINQTTYYWHFRYTKPYSEPPYITIIHSIDGRKICWRIRFKVKEHFLLNQGMPCLYQGEKLAINLNEPKYIFQLITYLIQHNQNLKTEHFDGMEILEKLGYTIAPIFIYDNKMNDDS